MVSMETVVLSHAVVKETRHVTLRLVSACVDQEEWVEHVIKVSVFIDRADFV